MAKDFMLRRNTSRMRQQARRIGIKVDVPEPHLPETEQEQADYISTAFHMGRDRYPWMGPMMLFQLNMALPNIAADQSDERVAWGVLRRDGTKRPAYTAVQQYAHEYNAAR